MNQKQKDKIKTLIANGCELKGHNWDAQGRYCFVGELLVACGIDPKKEDPDGAHRDDGVRDLPRDWRAAIRDYFGLNDAELESLQQVNDSTFDTQTRRTALSRQLVYCYEHPDDTWAIADQAALEEEKLSETP
jgi:hypothetical protein